MAPARRTLGDDRADELMAAGRTMLLDDTLALARSIRSSPPPAPRRASATTTPMHPLTRRESDVALLVGRGFTNPQIAQHLTITRRTVAAHLEQILDKLGFDSRTQVGVWAAAQAHGSAGDAREPGRDSVGE